MSEKINIDDLILNVKQHWGEEGVIVAGQGVSKEENFMRLVSNYLRVDPFINNNVNLTVSDEKLQGEYTITFTYK